VDRVLDRSALTVVVLGVVGGLVGFCAGAPRIGTAALVVTAFLGAALYYGPFEWLAITRHRHR
jgi:hypothetical protein